MRNDASFIRSMGITGTALTGRPCHVRQMDIYGQIAYHLRQGKEDVIAIDFQHDFNCSEDETATILYGLFTHEIMHAIRTDSAYKDRRLKEFPANEQFSRKDIWNIVEDPAIEYFARWEVSGTLFQCLQKTIRYLYEESPEIQDCGDDAWLQFVAALVMFGDVGVLKGKFTYPESLDCFKRCAPIMLKAIEEPDACKRFELSQEIFEIAKPLWEEHCDNNITANASESSALSALGVSESSGTGEPVSNSSYDADDDDTMQRRKQILLILEDSDTGDPVSSEVDSKIEDGQDPDVSGNGDSTNESGDSVMPKNNAGNSKDNGSSDMFPGTGSRTEDNPDTPDKLDAVNEKLCKFLEQASEEGLLNPGPEQEKALQDAIKQMMDAAGRIKNDEKQKAKRRSLDVDDLHLEVRSPYYKNSSMEIIQMAGTYAGVYDELCKKMHSAIVNFRAQIKKVLQDKYSKKEYSTKGKLSVDRMCGRKLTARVFEKRRMPDDKSDMAIVLMVDQSSSMSGSMKAVQETCTILMEAFSGFDIPVKLVGFTTTRMADAVYYHYGKWLNDRNVRMMIPGLSASGGTFLGHAIRYGGELLKKRPERHKLFIMITDAEPCYGKYKSEDDAYSDCRYAVQDISKYADVIGLGIYDEYDVTFEKAFRFIFGKDCITVNEPSAIIKDLPKMIGKFLKA